MENGGCWIDWFTKIFSLFDIAQFCTPNFIIHCITFIPKLWTRINKESNLPVPPIQHIAVVWWTKLFIISPNSVKSEMIAINRWSNCFQWFCSVFIYTSWIYVRVWSHSLVKFVNIEFIWLFWAFKHEHKYNNVVWCKKNPHTKQPSWLSDCEYTHQSPGYVSLVEWNRFFDIQLRFL